MRTTGLVIIIAAAVAALCGWQAKNGGSATAGGATGAIAADTLRGGIVGDNLGNVTIQSSQTIAGPVPTECVKSTAPFYAAWVSFGKPNCWWYARNCRGDVDGLKQGSAKTGYAYGSANDLNVLAAADNVKEPPFGPGVADCGTTYYNFFVNP